MGLWLKPGELYRKPLDSDIEWLSNFMGVSKGDVGDGAVWPATSRYFNKYTMEANNLLKFPQHDSLFYEAHGKVESWCLDFLKFGPTRPSLSRTVPRSLDIDTLLAETAADDTQSLSTIFLRHERLYYAKCTKTLFSVDFRTWASLLTRLDVLPSFLELLHNNNGGCVTHSSTNSTLRLSDSDQDHRTFHFAVKFGNWGSQEGAVYVRHELDRGKRIALFTGTPAYSTSDRFLDSFRSSSGTGLSVLEIILWFMHQRHVLVEQARWAADSMTQGLERQTAFYDCSSTGALTLAVHQFKNLTFAQNQVVADYRVCCVSRASCETLNMLKALPKQFAHYAKFLEQSGDHTITVERWTAIDDALQLQIQFAQTQATQISELNTRLRQQKDTIKTLIAQRDTRLNIEIAISAKRDSGLTRGITAMTMMFLPATCTATIFSMVMFHSDEGHSLNMWVDSGIWLYIAVTMPLTAALLFWYYMWSKWFDRNANLQLDSQAQRFGSKQAVRPFDPEKWHNDLSVELTDKL